jgi:hypothetical protein
MSLKAFHVVFVAVSLLLALGLGGWFLVRFTGSRTVTDLMYGLGWIGFGAGLIAYGRYFFRKLRTIGYL